MTRNLHKKSRHINPRLVIERKLHSILRKKPRDINPKLLKSAMDFSLAISKLKIEKEIINTGEFEDDLQDNLFDSANIIQENIGDIKPVVVKL